MSVAFLEKEKPKTSALRDDPARQRKVGGGYTAIDNGNGTFDLLDVEIFAELPEGAKRNKKPIGKNWMAAALAKCKAREAEGYLSPVHVYHSDEINAKPIHAGKLRLRDVRKITYEGRQLWALAADIVEIPADVFALIEKGQVPYRSVEVHDWDNPEIDSLALMPTDVPFFRLAMTSVSRIVKRGAEMFREKSPAVWHRPIGDAGSLILFRFEEKPSMKLKDDDKDEKKDEEKLADEDKKEEGGDEGKKEDPKKLEHKEGEDDDKKDDDKLMDEAVPAWAGQLLEILSAIAQKVGAAPPAQAPAEPPESDADLAPVAGMKANGKGGTKLNEKKTQTKEADSMDEKAIEKAVLRAMTPLVAKVSVLEKESGEMKREKAVAAKMSLAETELRGVVLDDGVKAHLAALAKNGDEELWKGAIETFKRSLPTEPPENLGEFEALIAKGGKTSQEAQDEIAKFTAKHTGPKAAQWAKAQLKAYQEYKALAKGGCDMSAEEWLEANLRNERPDFA